MQSIRAAGILLFALILFSNTSLAQDEMGLLIQAKSGQLDAAIAAAEASGGEVSAVVRELNMFSTKPNSFEFARSIRGNSSVERVGLDLIMQGVEPMTVKLADVGEQVGDPPNSGEDDIFFDLQWGADAIDLPEAWSTGYDGSGVKVAVLDSGIDHDHPDIAPNLNYGCSASFVPGEDWKIRPGVFFNHGTHVAGTVAAPDNGIGAIGVAPKAQICAVKVLSEFSGSGAFTWVLQGIIHAANSGADIINMSLGALYIKAGRWDGFQKENKALLEVGTNYANSKGVTIIASAGNDAVNLDGAYESLPAEAAHVLAVSAAAPTAWGNDPNTYLDTPSSFTNFGRNAITIGGPGGDFDGPAFNCTVIGITRPCFIFDMVLSTGSGSWFWAAGTSMAAPHVAGVAALIKDKYPWASPFFIKERLRYTADDKDETYFGKRSGRVNAYRALTQSQGSEANLADRHELASEELPQEAFLHQNHPNPFNPTTMISFQLPDQGQISLTVYNMLGQEVKQLANGVFDAGSHEVAFEANQLPSGTYLYRLVTPQGTFTQKMLLLK